MATETPQEDGLYWYRIKYSSGKLGRWEVGRLSSNQTARYFCGTNGEHGLFGHGGVPDCAQGEIIWGEGIEKEQG
jgi:hypothetical protein